MSHRMALKNEAGVMKERAGFMRSFILLVRHKQKNDGVTKPRCSLGCDDGDACLKCQNVSAVLLQRGMLLYSPHELFESVST